MLAAAVVVFTAFFLSARGFRLTRLDDDTDRVSDISSMRFFVELDEEREHVLDAMFVEVRELRLIPHGVPANSSVGPAPGHPQTFQRPPSAV